MNVLKSLTHVGGLWFRHHDAKKVQQARLGRTQNSHVPGIFEKNLGRQVWLGSALTPFLQQRQNLRPPASTPPPKRFCSSTARTSRNASAEHYHGRREENARGRGVQGPSGHARVLELGTLNRHDRHFQRVLQQYCVHKQTRVCSVLPRPKRGAHAWQRSPGTFGA